MQVRCKSDASRAVSSLGFFCCVSTRGLCGLCLVVLVEWISLWIAFLEISWKSHVNMEGPDERSDRAQRASQGEDCPSQVSGSLTSNAIYTGSPLKHCAVMEIDRPGIRHSARISVGLYRFMPRSSLRAGLWSVGLKFLPVGRIGLCIKRTWSIWVGCWEWDEPCGVPNHMLVRTSEVTEGSKRWRSALLSLEKWLVSSKWKLFYMGLGMLRILQVGTK